MIIEPKPADPDKRVPGAQYTSPVLKQVVPAETGMLVDLLVVTTWDGRIKRTRLIDVPRVNMWNASQLPVVTVEAVYEQEATE